MPPKKRGTYTAEEVATHNTSKSLWVIMNRKVYDVTMFHKRHPGGAAVILQMGGKDATAAATAAHKSILPGNLMWEFCIGSVVRAKKVEEAPVENSPAAKLTDSQAPTATPVTVPLPRPVPKPSAKQSARAQDTSPRSGAAAEVRPKPAAKKAAPKPVAQVAAPPPESQSAEKKKAQKDDSPKRKKSAHLEDDQHSSVCSRSAQGSDDMHDSLSDREHSPREGKEKSGVSAATDGLLEKIRAEPRLLRWSTRSDQQKLAYEVRRFIAGAMGTRTSTNLKPGPGDDHPTRLASTESITRQASNKSVRSEHGHKYSTKDLRVRVESHANEFIESLVQIVEQPHPLGEDVLVAAIAALNRDETRVSQFLEHIRVRNKHHGGAKDGTPQLDGDLAKDEQRAEYRRRPSTSMELILGTSSRDVQEEREEYLRASSPARNDSLAALCLCGRWSSPEKQLSRVANE